MPSLFHYIRRAPSKLRKMVFAERVERLHIGVDRVPEVTHGLPFRDVGFIFADHFIEHLHYRDAMYFLAECRRVLRDDGVLRLSTVDLDWVWASQYGRALTKEQQVDDAFRLNRAFRGEGHQFLYNFGTLEATLRDAGFANVVRVEGFEEISRILIVEASGRGGAAPPVLEEPRKLYLRDVE
jgi:predicted SAM-dependent methyltransferase